jgi:hypothetical protein
MAQLRKYGVTDETELKLEFFFYTNTEAKAESGRVSDHAKEEELFG